ncbi:hypothetical protein ARMSODRAFT_348841 [Armillaria solidipes]|uniref:Uncharacterized protein n=1 Tax=Armillaria solidipes TaxID=1076256 RepID=A0A2H3BTW8_9AGAR|nr:hypothetical protein ARMSODRAFT_348841 [Armillaria solidipes]
MGFIRLLEFWILWPTLTDGGCLYASTTTAHTAARDRCLERFLVGPLSGYLHDLRSGLIMGTGDEPDPRISMYHPHPNVWESIASDLTDHEMMEASRLTRFTSWLVN